VEQLAAQRVREALDRVLGAAVRCLERDASVRERRAHLDAHAPVARRHSPQRCERAVHVAEIGNLGHPPELGCHRLLDGDEHGDHGVVDPDVDGSEAPLHRPGRRRDLLRTRDIGGHDERLTAGRVDIASGAFEAIPAPGEKAQARPARRECARRRPPHAWPRRR
jgi:hypothetical protein